MKKELPKGLREFQDTLTHSDFSGRVLPLLNDLPESGLRDAINAHARSIAAIRAAEDILSRLKTDAARLALGVFNVALANWTIGEIQKATGYTDE